jgi:hypothetical protein
MKLRIVRTVSIVMAMVFVLGCGVIADKDRIKVAKFQDEYLTRGDLDLYIRELPDEERPIIRRKRDIEEVLEAYVDRLVKDTLAEQLSEEGKIHVPREMAEARYYLQHPDQRMEITNPEEVGMTATDISVMKQGREFAIDRVQEQMLGEAAVSYKMQEGVAAGVLTVDEEDLKREYELRKSELVNFETCRFSGMYFPGTDDNASSLAADLRRRIEGGEALDDIQIEFEGKGGEPLEATLANDPNNQKFEGFWRWASGAKPGTVVGPLWIQGWQRQRVNAQGQAVAEPIPNAYLTAVIEENTPETVKTFEEAQTDLSIPLLYAVAMDRLRKEYGVELYKDKLPDPSMYDDGGGQSIFDQAR